MEAKWQRTDNQGAAFVAVHRGGDKMTAVVRDVRGDRIILGTGFIGASATVVVNEDRRASKGNRGENFLGKSLVLRPLNKTSQENLVHGD